MSVTNVLANQTASPAKNYLANSNAEAGNIGFVTYLDAAAVSPVDGIGGTAVSTFTTSATSPLRGLASFLLTKDAANRQGEGFSYPFTIDSSDRGKVLNISMEYLIASGTYADNDMSFWIYDITNSRLIALTPSNLKTSGIIEKFGMEFQSSIDSTSYRLIGHIASTSALAYTIRFDTFNVSAQAKLYGSAVIDWVAYTPTVTNTTNATATGLYRRNGDSLDVRVKITWSGSGGTTAAPVVTLPSGVVIDTTKIDLNTSITPLGFGRYRNFGSTDYPGYTVHNTISSIAYAQLGAGINNDLSQVLLVTPKSGDNINLTASFPVVGWSSSQIMSSDADTRVVGFKVFTAGVYTTTTGAVIPLNTLNQDTHGKFNTSSFQYTIPVSGDYRFTIGGGNASLSYSAATQSNSIALRVNSASIGNIWQSIASVSGTKYEQLSGSLKVPSLKAGDIVDLFYSNNSVSGSLAQFYFEAERISGPSQIAASESVSALYTGAPPTGTLNTSFNTTTFGVKVKDSHNAYSGGTYTVPVSGVYDVSSQVLVNTTLISNQLVQLAIAIGGTVTYKNFYNATASASSAVVSVNVRSIPLLAGQLITMQTLTEGTTNSYSSSSAISFFSITRTGNY